MRQSGRSHKRKQKGKPARGTGVPLAEHGPPGVVRRVRSWFAAKGPVFRFVLLLVVLFGSFNVLFYVWASQLELFNAYLELNADISAATLRVLGHDVTAFGKSLGSSRFSVEVQSGCDALQSAVFLGVLVLISPVGIALRTRIPHVLLGTLFLLLLNVVRIASLYYCGAYYPRMFDVLHIDVWQPVFILLPLVLWLMWVRWAQPPTTETSHVPTATR